MAWVAVDKNGFEYIYDSCPERGKCVFDPEGNLHCVGLPKGTIKKLIGKDLDWSNEPVELKEE